MKNLVICFNNRIQQLEQKITGIENTTKDQELSVQQNVKSKTSLTKHPGNSGHYEKTKPKNNRSKPGCGDTRL